MKIALIGYGKMGHAIEALASSRGHSIVARIDVGDSWEAAREADVAVEFTAPATAVANIEQGLKMGLKMVVGTTGWYDRLADMQALCQQQDGTLFVASNFSIGMNLMFCLNRRLAQLMKGRDDYSVSICETHHIHKLDAPSGTALTLAQQIKAERGGEVPIESVREGEVAGIHTVCYDSPADTLRLTHEAHGRQGLALGALLAAEFVVGRKGCFGMDDMLRL